MNNSEKLKELILQTIDDQKGQDVMCIPLESKSAIADYIIISSGTSSKHIFSIKEKIYENIKKSGYKKISIEGEDGLNWIVIDLEDIIVHLFKPEVRDYYNLEKIWNH